MKYEVVLSKRSFADLSEIFDYIAYNLQSKENAAAQLSRLEDEIASLDRMPERYRFYDREPWRSRKVHILPVDNYCVLYTPNREQKTVTVLRVVYGGRNLDAIFAEYEDKSV
jgi:plasmid stabilization system protein ParE